MIFFALLDVKVLMVNTMNIFFSKVILFGSVAANNAHDNSDIDVALISEQFTDNPITNWRLLSPVKIISRKFTDIEPHPFTKKEFEEGDPFIDEIKRTGIEVN